MGAIPSQASLETLLSIEEGEMMEKATQSVFIRQVSGKPSLLIGLAQPPEGIGEDEPCLLYTSPSPRDRQKSRMPSSA